jgi:hypothetical protein
MKPHLAKLLKHNGHSKPTVEQHMAAEATLTADHLKSYLEGIADGTFPPFVPITAFVQARTALIDPRFLTAGAQQAKIHRNGGVPLMKTKGKASESAVIPSIVMVAYPGQKLNIFASVAFVDGVIQYQHPHVLEKHFYPRDYAGG